MQLFCAFKEAQPDAGFDTDAQQQIASPHKKSIVSLSLPPKKAKRPCTLQAVV
jgi:hypothetical protein